MERIKIPETYETVYTAHACCVAFKSGGNPNPVRPTRTRGGMRLSRRAAGAYRGRGAVIAWRNPSQRVTFWTFTVPDLRHGGVYVPFLDDRRITAQFRKLIENLRVRHQMGEYIWVAERQKRGYIHYHLLVYGGKYINVQAVNLEWCRLLHDKGYQCYSQAGLAEKSAVLDMDAKISSWDMDYSRINHQLAQCVDLKTVNGDITKVSRYITKYFVKGAEQGEIFFCRPHGSSKAIQKMHHKVHGFYIEDHKLDKSSLDWKEVQTGGTTIFISRITEERQIKVMRFLMWLNEAQLKIVDPPPIPKGKTPGDSRAISQLNISDISKKTDCPF